MRTIPKPLVAVGIVVLAIAVLVVIAGVAEFAAAPRLLAAHPSPSPSPSSQANSCPANISKGSAAKRLAASAAVAAEAQVLGISPQQLRAGLKQGHTVSALAAQKGLSQQAFSNSFTQAVTPLLNADVTQGAITQKQEQAALKHWAKTPPHWSATTKKSKPTPSPKPS
jgi:membrane-bound lytic murein transglycosylase B